VIVSVIAYDWTKFFVRVESVALVKITCVSVTVMRQPEV